MRKASIKHEYLRKIINEIDENMEDTPDETYNKLLDELKHSCLIMAGDIEGSELNLFTANSELGTFGMLFTDMDEYKKVFPNFEVEAHEYLFGFYVNILLNSDIDGYIINMKGENFILPRNSLIDIEELPENPLVQKEECSVEELKNIKNSINNADLEKFIENPQNIGKYEELIEKISDSTMLTLMVALDDVDDKAENGVISMKNSDPLGFLYIDEIAGDYATLYTSEEKISNIQTPYKKYSQLVNFSLMTNFILNDDMDGIIINPNSENILLSREMLLEYSSLISQKCNDTKLNNAVFHMFLLSEA